MIWGGWLPQFSSNNKYNQEIEVGEIATHTSLPSGAATCHLSEVLGLNQCIPFLLQVANLANL